MQNIHRRAWLLSLCLLIPQTGFSADHVTGLEPGTEQGINFVSGGIGSGQAQAMKSMRKDYNLLMTFAAKGSGEYLADIKVQIQDEKGNMVLETVSPGPLFYVQLPPNQYRVVAEYYGTTLTKTTKTSNRGKKELYFYWEP